MRPSPPIVLPLGGAVRRLLTFLPLALITVPTLGARLEAQVPDRYQAVVDLEIGEIDGPVSLTHVRSVLVLDDRLYLTQALDKQIRVLSTMGEPVAIWGRLGDGPGEYRFPQSLGFVDDRIVVVDWTQRRFTYLDRDGTVVATRPQPRHRSPTHSFVGPAFHGVGGKVIVFGSAGVGRVSEQWELAPVLVFSRDGAVVDSLRHRWGKRRVFVANEDASYSTAHPIVDGSNAAISPNGELFVVADHQSPDALLHLARYHVASGMKDTLMMNFERVHVPRSYADSVESELLEQQAAAVDRFGARALREAVRSPDRVTAVDALLVTNGGEIWFRTPNFGSEPDLWRVVTRDGRVRAEVEVPHGLELMAVSDRYLWAHHQDEYFVSYLSRLRLEAAGSGGSATLDEGAEPWRAPEPH